MKLLESKLLAYCSLLIVVTMIVVAMLLHTPWWGFIAIFFLFLALFSHLAALYIKKISIYSSQLLDKIAFWLLILSVVGLVAVYIISNAEMQL